MYVCVFVFIVSIIIFNVNFKLVFNLVPKKSVAI